MWTTTISPCIRFVSYYYASLQEYVQLIIQSLLCSSRHFAIYFFRNFANLDLKVPLLCLRLVPVDFDYVSLQKYIQFRAFVVKSTSALAFEIFCNCSKSCFGGLNRAGQLPCFTE